MLINGVDLSALGVELYDRILTSNNVKTTQEWLEGDIQPTFIRQQDKFKSITLKFLVLEHSEDAAFRTMSKLTAMLRRATILFDDINLLFDVSMDKEARQERLKNGAFVLTFNLLSDYGKGQTEVYTTDETATNYFNLRILYYQDGNNLIRSETQPLRSSDFKGNDTLESIGINVNKYKPDYYNNGRVTNMGSNLITYESMYELQVLIINYAPTVYSKTVTYLMQQNGVYEEISSASISFTKAQVDRARNVGDLIDLNFSRPNGYSARVNFDTELTFDNLMAWNLQVYFEPIENEQNKNITVIYSIEDSNGDYNIANSQVINVRESDFILNTTLRDILNLDAYRPNNYYDSGMLYGEDLDAIVSYASIKSSYEIRYNLTDNTLFVEYYYGEYPGWSRVTTAQYHVKYNAAYDDATDLISRMGINIDALWNSTYEHGVVYRAASYESYQDIINAGVIQIYYVPIDYALTVRYYQEDTLLDTRVIDINANMFLTAPALGEIIDINAVRPEGYIFDEESSYDGPVTLQALLANSPIDIAYKEVDAIRTKSIVVKYKQEFTSTFSTIQTSIITIEEAQVGGGIRLRDLININAYQPEYYETGIIDGYSDATLWTFDELQGEYSVLYMAGTYTTQVRYYTDEVANENWIGSAQLNYKVLDFSVNTTLLDLGLNVNAFKPSYCGNGQVLYTGPVNFAALRNLDSIDIIYVAEEEPVDPSGIDYPHRILFLQHNDMGDYESYFPTWTLNHAYINTGVTCADMSKLTVLVDTYRVFEETAPLYEVNVGNAFLFGSVSSDGSYYLAYQNDTKYTGNESISGINTFRLRAGRGTPELVIEESSSEGFSSNTGITASSRAGYSYGTLTYTHLLESNSARMTVPLFLFACDMNGLYRGGIAGVGIKSCKIYYDDELIRDFVPVATYDKIGDKISPSNCLYDKITQTFFEDARKRNSFNIIDDPDYVDTNPEHNIGVYYVNYYKDDQLFNATTVYCRESDFIDPENPWVPYDELLVDYFQPAYFKDGVITNLAELGDISFNNINGFVFRVNYELNRYVVTVNYYKDSANGELLASEEIELTERSFLSVPTFGDIIDIQKYKPEGYKPNWHYNDSRVTLARVLNYAPYDIIYTRVEDPQEYTFTVRYYKEGFGSLGYSLNPLQYYNELGTIDITIDETEFADGVYVEKFINFNALKPVPALPENSNYSFYANGVPYEWYLKDERLDSPEDLKSEYKVVYKAVSVPIELRYYTDEVDEENLIATTLWTISIKDWPDNEEFQVTDELPNKYINLFKPITCWGGHLVNPDQWYTFESLVAQGHLDIMYDTKEEPHNPDDADFPQKVIWFNKYIDGGVAYPEYRVKGVAESLCYNPWTKLDVPMNSGRNDPTGGCVYPSTNIHTPYFDLGYTPKELGRLRTELKGYAATGSCNLFAYNSYSDHGQQFAGIFGYITTPSVSDVSELNIKGVYKTTHGDDAKLQQYYRSIYHDGAPMGIFTYFGHTAYAGPNQYNWQTPGSYDGHSAISIENGDVLPGMKPGFEYESMREMFLYYQKGYGYALDEDLETQRVFDQYSLSRSEGYGYGRNLMFSDYWGVPKDLVGEETPVRYPNGDSVWFETEDMYGNESIIVPVAARVPAVVFNPLTGIIDAYHDYLELYDYANSNYPEYINVENHDQDVWEWRGKPAGPLRLWVTTNINNGKPNLKHETHLAYPVFGHLIDHRLDAAGKGNPYNPAFDPSYSYTEWVIRDSGKVDAEGNKELVMEKVTKEKGYAYSDFAVDAFPCIDKSMIWYIKVWDRDRLVRDLIPVAQGDQVYDFVAPVNGLFDKVTEIFFANANEGGTYASSDFHNGIYTISTTTVTPDQILPVHVDNDPTIWGKIVINYYDYDNSWLGNTYVTIPVHYYEGNEPLKDLLRIDEYKPDDFHHGGMIDVDDELLDLNAYVAKIVPGAGTGHPHEQTDDVQLKAIYDAGGINVFYKLLTFTKTVEYYRGNARVGSKDLFYTIDDIRNAQTLDDLGIDKNLYASEDYKPGRVVFNESILAENDIKAFIDAPSPVVIYDEYTKEERPDLLYINYYRGGAIDDELITLNPENPNYLDCNLEAKVLNPNGCIKYLNHYHTALYEDEKQDYFIAYQVDVDAKYVDVHKGPARMYMTLASITDQGRYTVIEEKRGWGRLREYPKGWINLAYTKPVYGPGQNPSYEQATSAEQVTIPYETEIIITKMTIDRLWGYVPEYASWVKMEEVSCTQLGRLYHALHQDVIHLDEIDWNSQPLQSLTDLGVEVNRWKLKYHDNANIDATSQLGRAQWTDRHVIEIIYPETIYAYNVYYYKDTIKPIPAKTIHHDAKYGIGKVTTIVNNKWYWWSDPEQFESTSSSYRSSSSANTPYIYLRALGENNSGVLYWECANAVGYSADNFSYDREMSEVSWSTLRYIPIEDVELMLEPEDAWDEIIPGVDPEIGRTSFSCSITEWNPDWDTFIETSWKFDDQGLPLNPTLYRDTEIKLGWDFFGIDVNEFKPNIPGKPYDDGLYLWNPRSYDDEEVNFTFEELISTGSQSILYLPSIEKYKAGFYLAFEYLQVENEEDRLNNFSLTPQLTDNGHWDVEVKFQETGQVGASNPLISEVIHRTSANNNDRTPNVLALPVIRVSSSGGYIRGLGAFEVPHTTKSGNTIITSGGNAYEIEVQGVAANSGQYGIVNLSNKRNASAVWRSGNDLTGYKSPFYISAENKSNYEVTRALDVRNPDFYRFARWEAKKIENDTVGIDYPRFAPGNDWLVDIQGDNKGFYIYGGAKPRWGGATPGYGPYPGSSGHVVQGWSPTTTPMIIYYVKVWKDYTLKQYWIPVPKGMYLPNGQQVSENAFYEVISNTLALPATIRGEAVGHSSSGSLYEDVHGAPVLVPLGQPMALENDYNWLQENRTGYQKEDLNLIGKTKIPTKVFDVPFDNGRILTTLPANFVMPITKQTTDAEYGIVGSWYYNEFGWVQTEYVEILPSNSYAITPVHQVLAIKGDTSNTQVAYNAYYGPDANKSTSALQFQSEITVNVYAETDDFIYTGYMWIPKSYTELNIEDINIQYAVSVQTLRIYSRPIADDTFLVGARLLGERITTTKQLVKDNEWQYIENEGWIYIHDAVSEVI